MKQLLIALVVLFLLAACLPASSPVDPRQLTFAPMIFAVPQVDRITLPNGMRLYLREDHELPMVRISGMFDGGALSEPDDKAGLTDLFGSTLRIGGAGERGPEEFDRALEELAINLSASVDSYATHFSLSARTADLKPALELLADMVRRPRFAPQRIEITRQQMLEGIRRRNDQPGAVASRLFRETLYAGHPFGRTPSVASVTAIERADLLAFQQRFFYPDNLWLAISGDFERADLLRKLTAVFGDWASGAPEQQVVPAVTTQAQGRVLVTNKDLPQTTVMIGELGIRKDNPDVYAVQVMNFILGGGGFNSRLMREIRSNRGLAYSVYSGFRPGRRLPGVFYAGCETKSASTLEAIDLLRAELRLIRDQPVSSEELLLAQESLVNSFVFSFDDSHAVVSQSMQLDFYDYPADYLSRYRERIAAVSIADVQRVAQTYLHPDQQLLVLVGKVDDFDRAPESLKLPVTNVSLD